MGSPSAELIRTTLKSRWKRGEPTSSCAKGSSILCKTQPKPQRLTVTSVPGG